MILVQTPLRVSFVGGGTDFKEYYTRCDGSVISAAIDKYVYVMVKKRFDDDIRVVYSNTEMVKSIDDIEHDLVREALRKTGVEKGVEIATFADIPSEGCGLGSSSAITIGLLNALYAYAGIRKTSEQLALEACNIEIDILKRPIGKQDQYIAAYGGIRHIVFRVDDTVEVNDLVLSKSSLKLLEERLLLLYTGMTRKSSEILTEQKEKMGEHFTMLDQMNGLVPQLRESMLNGVGTEFGRLLDENWRLKKQLASKISNSDIDECYERTLQAGATGGKICGAGGGGFLLLYCTPEKRGAVTEAAKPMREVKFRFERCGSTVLLDGRR
jgi:D-glycero-alpha-D-manno-heptose-7-phosphate kinase